MWCHYLPEDRDSDTSDDDEDKTMLISTVVDKKVCNS